PALSPPLLAARKLRLALGGRGVAVAGRPGLGIARPEAATALARDVSSPLGTILRFMNHESDNFTAEMLLKQLGAVAGGAGTTRAGATIVKRTRGEEGIDVTGVRM